MKMSEFTTKSFLGNAGAAENSYILINYEDNTTQRPVTYKASLQEIGKAIANDQKLYKKTQNGAITTNVSQGAYVNTAAENFASTGAVTAAVNGLASTGYVDNSISNAIYGLASEGYVTEAISGLASTGDLHSVPVQYSTNIFRANDVNYAMLEESQYSKLPLLGESDDEPAIYDTNSIFQGHLLSIGYVTDAIRTGVSTAIANAMQGTGETKYVSNYLQYYDSARTLNNITANMISGAASTGYVTSAISGLASTGYVTAAVANAGGGGFNPLASIATMGMFIPGESEAINGKVYPVMCHSRGYFYSCNPNSEVLDRINVLIYEINGNDLILKEPNGVPICTLTGVLNN